MISLIALLLGIGLGAFARLDFGERVSASLVHNVIRSAHNWSVAREAPSRVLIDKRQNTIRAEGQSVIGTWHFESLPIEGAFGLGGANLGGKLVEDGFVGQALTFAGEPARSHASIDVQADPAWDLRLGFAIECALRPGTGAGLVLDLGAGVVGIETTEHGSIKGWFSAELLDPSEVAVRGPRSVLETPPASLPAARWSQVVLRYDRARFAILVDSVIVAELEEEAPVWKLEGPLVISPGAAPWPGAIDNLVVSAVRSAEQSQLPRSVVFAANAPREIVFASGGGLDRQLHREPVRFDLEFEDGRKLGISVNLFGTIE